jgi:hypothetical protein
MPDVSVLIPAYRAEATLRPCILSLLAGGADLQILVESDDGTDYATVADLPGVEIAVTGALASGVGPTRNRALARARAPWIAYVDADDRVSPGYFAALLAAARSGPKAAAAQTEIWQGACLGRLAPATLDFPAMARHGASFRGLFAREICPTFVNDLSQDILHMAEILLSQGPLPMTAARYELHLGPQSLTAAEDFSARVEAAYHRHKARLTVAHASAPDLPAALALFDAKLALNRQFMTEGAGLGYYPWILKREGRAAAAG